MKKPAHHHGKVSDDDIDIDVVINPPPSPSLTPSQIREIIREEVAMPLSDITALVNDANTKLAAVTTTLGNIDNDVSGLKAEIVTLQAQVADLQAQLANGATPAELQQAADALSATVTNVASIAQAIDDRTA